MKKSLKDKEVAQLGDLTKFKPAKIPMFADDASSANNGGASRQGAISNINNENKNQQKAAPMGESEDFKKLFAELQTQMQNSGDNELLKNMAENMKVAADGIGGQLMEAKRATKAIGGLSGMGNMFSRGGINV